MWRSYRDEAFLSIEALPMRFPECSSAGCRFVSIVFVEIGAIIKSVPDNILIDNAANSDMDLRCERFSGLNLRDHGLSDIAALMRDGGRNRGFV